MFSKNVKHQLVIEKFQRNSRILYHNLFSKQASNLLGEDVRVSFL